MKGWFGLCVLEIVQSWLSAACGIPLDLLRTQSCGTVIKLLLGTLGCRILIRLSLAVRGGGVAITMPS
ncbi:MAG: hypothetical protein KDB03_28770, partial [Planctomycetales bacterium]|nr:hypothetical protein [Planctomycetales bacterium]